jgi:hypothetical protein
LEYHREGADVGANEIVNMEEKEVQKKKKKFGPSFILKVRRLKL